MRRCGRRAKATMTLKISQSHQPRRSINSSLALLLRLRLCAATIPSPAGTTWQPPCTPLYRKEARKSPGWRNGVGDFFLLSLKKLSRRRTLASFFFPSLFLSLRPRLSLRNPTKTTPKLPRRLHRRPRRARPRRRSRRRRTRRRRKRRRRKLSSSSLLPRPPARRRRGLNAFL